MKRSHVRRLLQAAFVTMLLGLILFLSPHATETPFAKPAMAADLDQDGQDSQVEREHYKAQPQPFRLPILAYHSVCGKKVNGNCVSTENFRAQLQHLHDAGYKSVSFEDLLRWEMGVGFLPQKPVVLTFDDGYMDNYTTVFPMLRERHMKGTVFLIITKVGQDGYLTWSAVRTMSRHGMEFGAHTRTHPNVTTLDDIKKREEIGLSKAEIEEQTGKPVIAFAYPYGKFDAASEQVVKDCGFRYAVSGVSGQAALLEEPLHLKRVVISGYVTLQEFRKSLP